MAIKFCEVVVLVLVVVSVTEGNKQANCDARKGYMDGDKCIFAVLNTNTNYGESYDKCRSYGAKLAIITAIPSEHFKKYLRDFIQPHSFAGFYVEGAYYGLGIDKTIYSGDGEVDLTGVWRFTYPRSDPARSRVVYDVWQKRVSNYELLEGFKNVPDVATYNILCQF